jgi:hypothetical protein
MNVIMNTGFVLWENLSDNEIHNGINWYYRTVIE